MATASLKYGTYAHPLMPRVEIADSTLTDDSGAKIGFMQTWTISGTLVGTSQGDLSAKIAQLETAYATMGLDLVLLASDGSTVLKQMISSQSIHGTRLVSRTYPGGVAPELATKRDYTLILTAGFLDAAQDTFDKHETTTYAVEQSGKIVRTVAGSLKTSQGVAASSKFTGKDPGVPAGYVRVRQMHRVREADNELDYEFVDRELFKPLPSGVLEGSSDRTEALGADGRRIVTVSGAFVGTSAASAAAAQKEAGSARIREAVTVNEYTGEVSFIYEYELAAGDNLLELSETIQVSASHERLAVRHTLGGAPRIQGTGLAPGGAIQSGHAVGRNAYPSFPSMSFAPSNLAAPPEKRRVSPRDAGETKTDWRIEWRYEFIFDSTSAFPAPETT